MSSTAIVSAACGVCHDAKFVPDPTHRGNWMSCPECCDTDLDPDPAGGAALTAGPVGLLEIWAHTPPELPIDVEFYPARFASASAAVLHARVWAEEKLATRPERAGWIVTVCDQAGNEFENVSVPRPTRAAA